MPSIKITMKDGTVKEFRHEGRSGGSWTKTLKLENGWAVITDEYDKRTIIPMSDIAEINETPERW